MVLAQVSGSSRVVLHVVRDEFGGNVFFLNRNPTHLRASPGAAVKLCLGDLLVMGLNPETASLHMQG